jgi:ABC-type uncharacterized transport system substrate-binding protein
MTAALRTIMLVLAALACASPASAHPHVWITMVSELIYAPDGSVTGIRHHWTFDDMFSVFAVQGLQSKVKGQFTRAELAPLAKDSVESMKDDGYFTYVTVGGTKVPFADPPPSDYWVDYKKEIVTLNFTLPFKTPVKAKDLRIEVYDPSYFIAVTMADENPIKLVGAPAGCKIALEYPQKMTYALGKMLSNEANASSQWGANFANKITVKCP